MKQIRKSVFKPTHRSKIFSDQEKYLVYLTGYYQGLLKHSFCKKADFKHMYEFIREFKLVNFGHPSVDWKDKEKCGFFFALYSTVFSFNSIFLYAHPNPSQSKYDSISPTDQTEMKGQKYYATGRPVMSKKDYYSNFSKLRDETLKNLVAEKLKCKSDSSLIIKSRTHGFKSIIDVTIGIDFFSFPFYIMFRIMQQFNDLSNNRVYISPVTCYRWLGNTKKQYQIAPYCDKPGIQLIDDVFVDTGHPTKQEMTDVLWDLHLQLRKFYSLPDTYNNIRNNLIDVEFHETPKDFLQVLRTWYLLRCRKWFPKKLF